MSRIEAAVAPAVMFAALGDPTRLAIIERLARRGGQSIAALGSGYGLTRQAITKHLHVLERAEIVQSQRAGRKNLYALRPERTDATRNYLTGVAAHWDAALQRLKAHLEQT